MAEKAAAPPLDTCTAAAATAAQATGNTCCTKRAAWTGRGGLQCEHHAYYTAHGICVRPQHPHPEDPPDAPKPYAPHVEHPWTCGDLDTTPKRECLAC